MDGHTNGDVSHITHIPLSYVHDQSRESALRLVYYIRPKWREDDGTVEIVRFTDGITNTLLQMINRREDWSEEQQENESILMRAYGNNTHILIDRNREAKAHALLAERNLAPELIGRFENGLLYRFIRGKPCKPEDLTKEKVWRGVAKRLAEWHARIPIAAVKDNATLPNGMRIIQSASSDVVDGVKNSKIDSRQPSPNLWTVMQKWTSALPTSTEGEQARKSLLQEELERSFIDLDSTAGIGHSGFVFGHCDLLCGNVILTPSCKVDKQSTAEGVSFIDYEYATPCPAAFDIANHFAEWGGFDCDYNMLPTRSVRRAFLHEYLESYRTHLATATTTMANFDLQKALAELEEQVDRFRGMPGLYWGIWALIQAEISEIDFDYSNYAEVRLGEYWAWRNSEKENAQDPPLREKRWSQEQ